VALPRRTSVLIALALGAALAAGVSPASAESLDGKISALRSKIASEKQKEGVLSTQIAAASDDIRSLEGSIDELSIQLASLESQLTASRARLAKVQDRFATQTDHLHRLTRDHAIAERRLERRIVELYESDQSDSIGILLGATSLDDLIASIDYMQSINRQDRHVAEELKRLEGEMRVARRETAKLKKQVEAATAVLTAKTTEAQEAHSALVSRQSALEGARSDKKSLLGDIKAKRENDEEDLEAMQAASAAIQAQIQANGSSTSDAPVDGSPSASGFIWPVSGPITSPFGWRWGRMHEGIDIGAPTGTAIHAAKAGTVIFAGVQSGYGNMVIIDHGGGVATAYGHMSAIWVGGGTVSQGQGIGAVGCTGHCFGPHLHFEVRINGAPVNPLNYL
jgi:murein DD-endopeptidase MepM/ murein hydrolase activator NlpD